MDRFELRGEPPTTEAGKMRWHITRPGSPLTLCSRVVQQADTTVAIAAAESIPQDTMCPLCWAGGMHELQLPERRGEEPGGHDAG
jgi:hypothetical protein